MRPKSRALLILFMLMAVSIVAQTVTFSISEKTLKPSDKGIIRARLDIPSDRKQSVDPNDNPYLYLEAKHPDLEIGEMILPKPTKVVSATEWQYYPQITLSLPFTVKANARPGARSLDVLMSYNLCYESGMCDPPEEQEGKIRFEIVAPITPDMIEEGPISLTQMAESPAETEIATEQETQSEEPPSEAQSVDDAALPEAVPTTESVPESTTGWQEVLKYLIFAFLGGLILNITPCVLPILPIRIMAIVNQAQKDRSKVLRHVMVYALGVLISFAILAAIFIGIQAAGQSAGWGTQNQNPYFQVALMAIVFVFALSLLGVFEITLPGMDAASKATSRGGYGGSFFGGIFAFLMAISCTGPFLGAALPFAMGLAPLLILLFFLMIGLGFAFPFILIGLFPKALKIIPKPGNWMVLFKELMGFVLLYLVFTMLKTAFALTSGAYLLNLIWFLLILGFAVWLYGKYVRFEYSKTTQWIFTILPVILIIAAAWLYLPVTEDQKPVANVEMAGSELVAAPNTPAGWYIFSPQLHEKLLADGKPVFLDIGAEWCKNCKTNEKTVLFTQEIMQDFNAKGVVLLKGDFTKKDPVLLDWITKHKRLGVPFNALYIPGMEPTIFPELISKNMIREALSKIPQGD